MSHLHSRSDARRLWGFGVDPATQAQLRAIAAETVLVYRPRQWCPADPVAP